MSEDTDLSAEGDETCILCLEQEVAKLLSLYFELNLELKSREDVQNFISISGHSYLYNDPAFVEKVIDALLEQI